MNTTNDTTTRETKANRDEGEEAVFLFSELMRLQGKWHWLAVYENDSSVFVDNLGVGSRAIRHAETIRWLACNSQGWGTLPTGPAETERRIGVGTQAQQALVNVLRLNNDVDGIRFKVNGPPCLITGGEEFASNSDQFFAVLFGREESMNRQELETAIGVLQEALKRYVTIKELNLSGDWHVDYKDEEDMGHTATFEDLGVELARTYSEDSKSAKAKCIVDAFYTIRRAIQYSDHMDGLYIMVNGDLYAAKGNALGIVPIGEVLTRLCGEEKMDRQELEWALGLLSALANAQDSWDSLTVYEGHHVNSYEGVTGHSASRTVTESVNWLESKSHGWETPPSGVDETEWRIERGTRAFRTVRSALSASDTEAIRFYDLGLPARIINGKEMGRENCKEIAIKLIEEANSMEQEEQKVSERDKKMVILWQGQSTGQVSVAGIKAAVRFGAEMREGGWACVGVEEFHVFGHCALIGVFERDTKGD